MKIIHRYISKEFIGSFIFGLAVFSTILLLDQVFQLVNLALGKGVSLYLVTKLFLLVLPGILSLTVPMAVLFGILLAYGRLSEDNEITAFRSVGFNYLHYTYPVLVIVFMLSMLLVYFNQNLAPSTHRNFRKLYKEVISQRPLIKFEEKSITRIDNYRIYVEDIAKKDNLLKGVNIYKFSETAGQEASSTWRITASSGIVSLSSKAIIFHLFKGYWQKPNPSLPENLVHLKFSAYKFSIPLGEHTVPVSQSIKEMNGRQLLKEISEYKQKNLPYRFLETEYWLRWTLALAPFILAIAGIPLGIVLERGGKSISFGLSLLILFGYYLLMVTGINIGEKGYVSPKYILWLPNIVVLIIGLMLWKKMIKK